MLVVNTLRYTWVNLVIIARLIRVDVRRNLEPLRFVQTARGNRHSFAIRFFKNHCQPKSNKSPYLNARWVGTRHTRVSDPLAKISQ